MKRHNSGLNGPGAIDTDVHRDLVVWVDHDRTQHVERAGPAVLHHDLVSARRIRTGHQYKGQRNYHGVYSFSQTGQHVWYESLFEMTALMTLDFAARVDQIASQPMMLQFASGRVHYPDFFAVHSDGRQVLYDVRPESRITTETQEQFDETRRLAGLIGWEYELFTHIDPLVVKSLEWLSGYRHRRYDPAEGVRDRVLRAARTPTTLTALADVADPELRVRGSIAVYNLLWKRDLVFDMTRQLTSDTLLCTKGTR